MPYKDLEKHRTEYNEYHKNWERKNWEKRKEKRDEIRTGIINLLGGQCLWCGFSDIRALQIDHVVGGGNKERKKLNRNRRKFYKIVTDSFLNQENKYQILCSNCNQIKKVENNEVPRGARKL